MANVKITLTHPTTRTDGTPLPLSEIKHVLLETRAEAATVWAAVGAPMLPGTLERTVQLVPAGQWRYRATWVDTSNKQSVPVEQVIVVPLADPSPGTITVTLV